MSDVRDITMRLRGPCDDCDITDDPCNRCEMELEAADEIVTLREMVA